MVVGTDIPAGQEVKWYAGSTVATETKTLAAGDITAGYIALAKKAEYGSVIVTKLGVLVTGITEMQTGGTLAATETSGTNVIKFTSSGLIATDVIAIQYIDIETSALVQIAACLDVKTSFSADVKTEAIHGQANKLIRVGAVEQEAELEEFQYSQDFVALLIGDQLTGNPATGMNKLTTKAHGMKKIGCLVGKRYSTAGVVLYKWFLIGCQTKEVGKEFPTEEMYKDSMKFSIDEYLEVDLVA